MMRDIPGSGNWLPGQNVLEPPSLTIDITFDASITFGSTTGTGYDAIAAGIKAAVLAVVEAAEGMLTTGAVAAAVVGAPGVASCNSVTFNSDATVAEVAAPVAYIAAEYVRLTCRTIR